MKFRPYHLLYVTLLLSLTRIPLVGQATLPFQQCPSVGADSSCAILIIVTDSGIEVASDPSQGPFDQIEDTLIGVQNNSHQTLFSLPLNATIPIFGLDGDGLCLFINCTWPHPTNYEGQTSDGGAVSFSNINASQTSGIVNFPGGIKPGGSAFFSLEERIQTLCSPLNVQPALKQGDSPWGALTYDSAPTWAKSGQKTTIGRWGCYLTSAVMLINYQAVQQNHSFRSTPDDLNAWLQANSHEFKTAGNVTGPDIQRYVKAKTNGTLGVFYQGPQDGQDDFALDNYLCTNNPVVLKVPVAGSTHFVLATGQTLVGGKTTFLINDPGFNQTDLSQKYGFKYLGIRKFSASPAPPHALIITGHSPIELLATDPLGNTTGFNPVLGTHTSQIPSSGYSTDSILDDIDPSSGDTTPPVKMLEILTPIPGIYNLRVFGTGVGAYTIDFDGHDTDGNPHVESFHGSAIPGAISDFTVGYSPIPGSQVIVKHLVTIDTLISDVSAARDSKLIEKETAKELIKELNRTSRAIVQGNTKAAAHILRELIDKISEERGEDIQLDAAQLILDDAKALFLALGGTLTAHD